MTRIKKSQSSLCRRHTGQELLSRGQPSRATKVLIWQTIKSNHRFRPSLHIVGKWICLVVLWPNPLRRDKPWNYIALEFQRYTKHLLITGNLYRQIENVWGIPFPKGMEQKDGVLGELFRKLVFHSLWSLHFKSVTSLHQCGNQIEMNSLQLKWWPQLQLRWTQLTD
jgi:hypothetical protein